jgi:F0F1-type ATP synthase epsilon subunit
MKDVTVELSTPSGRVFAATAASIDVRTEDGSVHITPRENCYLSMVHATEVTLQVGQETLVFVLENAVASLKAGSLTVLAESIRQITPRAVENGTSNHSP